MGLMEAYLPQVERYIRENRDSRFPVPAGASFLAAPLAQGEYNLNYRIVCGGDQWVFRVNIGSQIGREDQIFYEYRALKLLEKSGVTPKPVYVDDTRKRIERGVLVMEFLPGEPLDYMRDLKAAAGVFARIHQLSAPDAGDCLIAEGAPLSMIYDECAGLLSRYFQAETADPEIRAFLREVLAWAGERRKTEAYYQQDPWPCIVNTEVNSHNFIVDRSSGAVCLVDWEMPRWGDPSQDLSHFCSPLTTLWKTRYRMSAEEKKSFLGTYAGKISDPHLRDTLEDRVRLRDPFVLLRGISWSAMGWIAYQTDFNGVRNPSTWQTLQRYMQIDFIRSLFEPHLNAIRV